MGIDKRILGPEDPTVLSSMFNLAYAYSSQELWKEAEKLGVQGLEIRELVEKGSSIGYDALRGH